MGTKNIIGAHPVKKQKLEEQETIKAKIKADIAIVLPEEIGKDAQIALKYDAIAKVVNDYIESYTIDARISEVDLYLSAPELPDSEATANLKGVLTGEKKEVVINENMVQVDNEEIGDDKVNLRFELSVEETVFFDGDSQSENKKTQSDTPQSQKSGHKSHIFEAKNTLDWSNESLVIQSSEPKLYWQSAPTAQLYLKNAPSDASQIIRIGQRNRYLSQETKDKITDYGLEGAKIVGSGLNSAEGGLTKTARKIGDIKVGDNGRIYTSPKANGNRYYKIIGNLADNKVVKRMGIVGKSLSYGAMTLEAYDDYSNAETSRERGEVFFGTAGKIGAGWAAGTVATVLTTTVLVAIASSSAPLTLVVIAGCAIVASTTASNIVEPYGEKLGREMGGDIVEKLQNWNK